MAMFNSYVSHYQRVYKSCQSRVSIAVPVTALERELCGREEVELPSLLESSALAAGGYEGSNIPKSSPCLLLGSTCINHQNIGGFMIALSTF